MKVVWSVFSANDLCFVNSKGSRFHMAVKAIMEVLESEKRGSDE